MHLQLCILYRQTYHRYEMYTIKPCIKVSIPQVSECYNDGGNRQKQFTQSHGQGAKRLQ